MESEVNVHWNELINKESDRLHILPLILYRIAMCLDVYTEAYSAHQDTQETDVAFQKKNLFMRAVR